MKAIEWSARALRALQHLLRATGNKAEPLRGREHSMPMTESEDFEVAVGESQRGGPHPVWSRLHSAILSRTGQIYFAAALTLAINTPTRTLLEAVAARCGPALP